ncbi:MAG: B12-binding domain-containing radical SAM protein [Firmicutes bacterium]|nr:B12-binding domain-containing radical SAM protein [Bacillota bacterium]
MEYVGSKVSRIAGRGSVPGSVAGVRVLLVAPRAGARREGKGRAPFPPLGLLAVAGATPPEVEVRLVDEAVEPLEYDARWDLVGITSNTAQAPRAYASADAFRGRGVPVVLGGIHPSALPEEALRHADAVVVGEAEGLWPRVLRDLEQGRLQRIYRGDGHPRLEGVRVRRDLLRAGAYLAPQTVQTTRGCPYNCSFCSVTRFFGATFRTRPVEEVVGEVAALPGDLVVFVDDNIVGRPTYARRLFGALRGLGKKWLSQASVNNLRDGELVKLAAASGCRGLFIGFETLSLPGLRSLRKGTNDVRTYAEVIARLHSCGIGVIGAFILGLDEDGPDVFDRVLEFSYRARVDLLQVSILTPFPGTALWQQLEGEGRIFDRDWSKYNGNHVVFWPKRLSPERLQEGFRYVLREAYSLRGIWRRLSGPHRHSLLFGSMNLVFRRGVRNYLARG